MIEKEILKATVSIESYPKILEETFLMLAKKTVFEKTNPAELGRIVPALMGHLQKICASFTPMMDDTHKAEYLEMLTKSFREGLELEFSRVEQVKKFMEGIMKGG